MAGTKPKVLIVLTSHNQLGDTGKPTGWYLPEFAHPYYALEPHADIVIASPKGGEAPLDQGSVEAFKSDKLSVDFLENKNSLWKNTEKISSFLGRADEFAALFYVGGHGPMFDLAKDSTSGQLISEFSEKGKVISAVCHGPAALIPGKTKSGQSILAGHAVTGFSNAEEDSVGLSSVMPFLLEDELTRLSGGKFEKAAEPWGEKVVVSNGGKLITGQNPASATGVGKAIVTAISA
ncbi:MAG: hypothetical protein M1825_005879 [Sarcosagium campestre]|nr:MAG: hypothetical protein M1825_005879 [Sarcosagium campestre]